MNDDIKEEIKNCLNCRYVKKLNESLNKEIAFCVVHVKLNYKAIKTKSEFKNCGVV